MPSDISGATIWLEGNAPSPLPWWDGSKTEAWRILIAMIWLAAMNRRMDTLKDWLGAFVDIGSMLRDPAIGRFWLEEIEIRRIPRNWIHMFAVEYVQMHTKIGHGNAVDQQHSAYLPDCDAFLSEDKRYLKVLSVVRDSAPFSLPKLLHVRPAAWGGALRAIEASWDIS